MTNAFINLVWLTFDPYFLYLTKMTAEAVDDRVVSVCYNPVEGGVMSGWMKGSKKIWCYWILVFSLRNEGKSVSSRETKGFW
jgi:hypothetical protein